MDRLLAGHDAMSASFDRTLTTLAAGSLALSISFVKDIAEHPTSVWMLKTSWICMAAALALILVSYEVSMWVHKRLIAANGYYGALPAWMGWIVTATNRLATAAFLTGACFLVAFALVNVQ
jgi:hypothetical protein